MISAPGLLPAEGGSMGPWVHSLAVPSGDQEQTASSAGTTFSWTRTPARIYHLGPFNMGPQWPRGQSLQPQFDKRIRKEAQRNGSLPLEKQTACQSIAIRRSLTCWGRAGLPLQAVNQPGFPQGESRGKYPQILRWTRQPADILSFVPTITQQDENDGRTSLNRLGN